MDDFFFTLALHRFSATGITRFTNDTTATAASTKTLFYLCICYLVYHINLLFVEVKNR